MTYSIVISRRAARDLEAIRTYSVERWGSATAERYFEALEQGLQRLQEDSSLLRARPDISSHFRFYRVREHFFVCFLEGSRIYVLAVRHGSMDLPNRLAELEPQLAREAELLHKTFLAKNPQH